MATDQKRTDWEFAGRWIGESQGCDSPAHIWEIRINGDTVQIDSCWEGDPTGGPMFGTLVPGEPAFTLGPFRATLVDPEHFIIAGWDTNDMRGGVGPDYDVVFSRPGIAELAASQVYRKWSATAEKSQPARTIRNRNRPRFDD